MNRPQRELRTLEAIGEELEGIESLTYNNIPSEWKFDCGNRQIECIKTRASICDVLDGRFDVNDRSEKAVFSDISMGEYIVLLKEFFEIYRSRKGKLL